MRALPVTIIFMFLSEVAVAYYPLATNLTPTRHYFVLCFIDHLILLSPSLAVYYPVAILLNLTSCSYL